MKRLLLATTGLAFLSAAPPQSAESLHRVAILCFEGCLDAGLGDAKLTDDAKHNLELAKLLWAQARVKDAAPDRPNDPPPEEAPDRPPPKPDTGPDVGPDTTGGPDAVGP